MNFEKITRKAKRFVRQNALVMLICLNGLLLVQLSLIVRADLVANEQIIAGVMGYTENGVYTSLSGRDVMDSGHQFRVNGDRYAVVLETSRPRNVTSAQLIGSKSYTYELPNGTKMTYQWYEKLYQFELVAYTKAKGSELAPLIKQSQPTRQLYYKYDFCGAWWDPINDYAQILAFPSDSQRLYCEYSGWYLKENQADLAKLNTMELTARIGVVIGDTVQPAELIRETGWDGEYTLQGTSYYLTKFDMLKPGSNSYTSTGYIQKQYIENPFDLPKKDVKVDSKNETNALSGGTASQAQGVCQFTAGDNQIKVEIGQSLHETPTNYVGSGGYMQSIPTYNKGLSMHSIESDAEIARNYVPDKAVLPSPNIQCYVNIPIQMTPEVILGQCQMGYTYIEHGFKDCGWLGGGVRLLHDVYQPIVDSTVYTKSTEAFNVYYIQTIQFAVNFASIYEWEPDASVAEPALPPIEIEHPPTELPPTTGGDTGITIHEEFPTVMEMALALLANPVFIFIVIVAIVGLVIFITIYMKKVSILTNPTKMVGELRKMMGGLGAVASDQPVSNTFAVVVNNGDKYVKIAVSIISVISVIIAVIVLNNIYHFLPI